MARRTQGIEVRDGGNLPRMSLEVAPVDLVGVASAGKCLPPPDFSEANQDLDDLIRLSRAQSFDLHGFLLLISEAGFPTFAVKTDEAAAVTALGSVIHYQLGKPLQVLLAAMRAGDFDPNEVQNSPGRFGLGSQQALASNLIGHSDLSFATVGSVGTASVAKTGAEVS